MKSKNISNRPLFCEYLYKHICAFFQEYRLPFLFSLIIGLISHMFVFTNKLINHDELYYLFGKGVTIGSGRWGLVLISPFFPDVSMPWIYGIFSIILISLSGCLIIRIFRVKTPWLQAILSGLIISFPALTGTFSYMFTSIYYAVAFLLSVLAVYLLCIPQKHKMLWCIPALMLSVLSTGIYQAYISISASLLVLFLIRSLLDPLADEYKILKQGMLFVTFLILSLGCYWILSKFFWIITGSEMNSYSQEAVTFSLSTLITGICNAYHYFAEHLFKLQDGIVRSVLSSRIHIFCLLFAFAELVIWAVRTRKLPKVLLMAFLVAILPLAINCMYIFIDPHHIHTLVLYSFISVYVFVIIAAEAALENMAEAGLRSPVRGFGIDLATLFLSLVILFNMYSANEAYLSMHLRYENFYAFCTSAVTQLHTHPEYTANTPVAIIGNYPAPDFYEKHFISSNRITGTAGASPDSWSKYDMFRYYIGHELTAVDEETERALAETPEFAAMPAYPSNGYIQMIGDTIVIKLS